MKLLGFLLAFLSLLPLSAALPTANFEDAATPVDLASGVETTSLVNTTALSLATRGGGPTVPPCDYHGNFCILGMQSFDWSTAVVLSVFDWYCNLIGYNDNVPIGPVFGFDSQLPYVINAEVLNPSEVVFKYAGHQYGYESTISNCWQDQTPGWGFPWYCQVLFMCPPA